MHENLGKMGNDLCRHFVLALSVGATLVTAPGASAPLPSVQKPPNNAGERSLQPTPEAIQQAKDALPTPPMPAPAPKLDLPQLPRVSDAKAQAGEVLLETISNEVKPLLPDPNRVAEWFMGHGGAILGTSTGVVVPLGNVAPGPKSGIWRSHLPGLRISGDLGILFLRRWGVVGHGGYTMELKGTDSGGTAQSWSVGLSGRFLLFPREMTPYVDLGVTRNTFWTAMSFDGHLGLGYLILTAEQKFICSPFAAVDIGQFPWVEQSLNGQETAVRFDQKAWHYILTAGVTFAYHKRAKSLVGAVPQRPDDPDNDLIFGTADRCPNEREDYYPPDPNDGCPSLDWDEDGIPNAKDACPTVAEDALLPKPSDGCPTTDRDQDGIADDQDRCPRLREDLRPPEPADGCPSPDRDSDGIDDQLDRCPDEPETTNGFLDADGCPDEVPSSRVRVDERSVRISDKIYFEKSSAEISARSFDLLDELAAALKSNPRLELIEIQGHADDIGTAAANVKLTKARAESVRVALAERGVTSSRLAAVGYGAYCPLDGKASVGKANENNRRVEFRVVRTATGPTGLEMACPEAIVHGIRGTLSETGGTK